MSKVHMDTELSKEEVLAAAQPVAEKPKYTEAQRLKMRGKAFKKNNQKHEKVRRLIAKASRRKNRGT